MYCTIMYSVLETIYLVVVLFYAQHAAITNCEQTVGDNITLLHVLFSFDDCCTIRK